VKGQTQAITAVLITSVIVGAIATAYVWGGPLLQKGQAEADLDHIESEVIALHDQIEQISQSGSGAAETITLDLETDTSGNARIEVNETGNYIDVVTAAESVPYPIDTWTLIEGENLQNLSIVEEGDAGDYAISGQDSSGVVAVYPVGGATENIVTYRVEFRNMLTDTPEGSRLQKIDLETVDGDTETGEVEIVLTNRGDEFDSGYSLSTGESIDRERTVVQINLR